MSYTCTKHGSTHHYYLNGERVKSEEVPKSVRDTLRCSAPTYLQLAGRLKGQKVSCVENFNKDHKSLGKHYYSDGSEIQQKNVPVELKSVPCASRYEGEAPILPRKPTKFRKAKSPPKKAKSPSRKAKSPPRRAKSPPKKVSPPRKAKSPPRKAKSLPKKLSPPPQKAKSPPRKAKSPQKAKSPPKKSPGKAKSPPKRLVGVKQVASKAARVPRKQLPPPPPPQRAQQAGEVQKPLLKRKV